MTYADLAKASGVPYHQIHTWTRRENAAPKAASLKKVATALGVTDEFLLEGIPLPGGATTARQQLLQQLDLLSEEELRVLLAAANAMRAAPDQTNG